MTGFLDAFEKVVIFAGLFRCAQLVFLQLCRNCGHCWVCDKCGYRYEGPKRKFLCPNDNDTLLRKSGKCLFCRAGMRPDWESR